MNQKKAKVLRKLAGYDPKAERMFVAARRNPRKRHGSKDVTNIIRTTHVATGARRKYRNLKRAYTAGRKDMINAMIRPLEVAMRAR